MIDFTFLPEQYDIFTKIFLTIILSGVIGLEREIHGRAAGFRTNILVGLGATVFTIISIGIASKSVTFDPGRIAAQIVTGIGFLGAGAIIKYGMNIKGLTTASCLWIVAAIGMASGSGEYFVAIVTAFVSIFSLLSLNIIENVLPIHSYRSLLITTRIDVDTSDLIQMINGKKTTVMNVDYKYDHIEKIKTEIYKVRIFNRGITDKVFKHIYKTLQDSELNLLQVKWQK